MTGDEFKAARRTLGLSVNDLSFIINTSDRNIRRWEDGTRPPNPVAVEAMGWFLDGFEPPRMKWLLDGKRPDEWKGE